MSKSKQKDLRESAHKIWLAGLGALATAEEEGTRAFKKLVEKGEEFEARGRERVEKMKEKVQEARGKAEEEWEKVGSGFDSKVSSALKRLGVPTRDEIKNLTQRVEELTIKVDQLKSGGAAAKKASSKKASSKKASSKKTAAKKS